MRTLKFLKIVLACVLVMGVFWACDDDPQRFDTIAYVPCDDDEVTIDPNVVTDFECQDNFDLDGVETLRNPAEVAVNPSKFVGKLTDGTGPWDALVIDYGGPIDLSTNALFKIKVKTEVAGILKVKLEGGTSTPVELDQDVAGDFKWTEYQFNFSNQAEENHTKLVVFFNAGEETSGNDVYFIDDLYFDTSIDPCEGVAEDLSILADFDCQQNFFIGNVDDTGEETTTPKILNPYKEGINDSEFVGEYTDNGGAAWDNLYISTEDKLEELDLSVKNQLKVKIYSTVAVPLLAKLQGNGTENEAELPGTIEVTDEWVEYTFDFRGDVMLQKDDMGELTDIPKTGNTTVVLFFDPGNTSDTDYVYLVDDIRFEEWIDPCAGVTPDLSVLADFDCQQNYFIGNVDDTGEETTTPRVENPFKGGINTSDYVGMYTDKGFNKWDNLYIDTEKAIDLTVKNRLSFKVYSTVAVPIAAKLQGSDGGAANDVEIEGEIVTTDEWVEYTFDFVGDIMLQEDGITPKEGQKQVVIFFDFAQNDGPFEQVFYVDDIQFVPGDGGDCDEVVDDCTGVTPDLSIVDDFACQRNGTDFYDPSRNVPTVVDNPFVSCGNPSSKVGEYIDDGTEPWAGVLLVNYDEPIDLSKPIFKFKLYSKRIVDLVVKLEGGIECETEPIPVLATDLWFEYEFDMSCAIDKGNPSLVVFIDHGGDDGTTEEIYYIDDLRWEAE